MKVFMWNVQQFVIYGKPKREDIKGARSMRAPKKNMRMNYQNLLIYTNNSPKRSHTGSRAAMLT